MKIDVPPLERAFQIARSGSAEDVDAIKDQLKREVDDIRSVEGKSLNKQLRELMKEARESKKS